MRELKLSELEAVVGGGCDSNLDPNSPDYEEERAANCQEYPVMNPGNNPNKGGKIKVPKWKIPYQPVDPYEPLPEAP